MYSRLLHICCLSLLVVSSQDAKKDNFASATIFRLAPPVIQVDSLIFTNSAQLEAIFDMPEAVIRFTDDGSEVTRASQIYTQPIQVTEASEFAFRAFHPDYRKSSEIYTRLIRIEQQVSNANVSVEPNPHPNYLGQGTKALVDLQKGTTQFRAGKQWLGFQNNQVTVRMDFKEETTISNLIISTLNDHSSWIFIPKAIRVFTNKEQIGELMVKEPSEVAPKQVELLDVPVSKGKYTNIEIQVDLMDVIPEWHQGKGTIPFFFIDEILVQ